MEIKNVFQLVSVNRKLSIVDKMPEKGNVSININLQSPPQLTKFKGSDAVLVSSTVNISFALIADVIMKGESVLILSKKEKKTYEESMEKDKKLPEDMEKKLMTVIARRAVLLLTKSSDEIGIPPPVPLPAY